MRGDHGATGKGPGMRSIAFSRWLVVLGLAGHAVACNPGSPPPPPPLPGPMCTDSDTDQGGPPCGLNGNGTDDLTCVRQP